MKMFFTIALAISTLAGCEARACPTTLGMDFASINARTVLVKGAVKAFNVDRRQSRYYFELSVIETLKGSERATWNVYTTIGQVAFAGWPNRQPVYIGFDPVDLEEGTGKFPNLICSPLGIVAATDENLKKIKQNVRETGGF